MPEQDRTERPIDGASPDSTELAASTELADSPEVTESTGMTESTATAQSTDDPADRTRPTHARQADSIQADSTPADSPQREPRQADAGGESTDPAVDDSDDPDRPTAAETADRTDTEREWWDDPRMPWKGKPGRADLLCWAGFSLSGIIGLIMIPLRPILLGASPLALVAITGSRSGLVTIGAMADVGRAPWWPRGLAIGIVRAMKWDPLFWWAGRLWGRGLIEVVAGRSRWAAANADRAERLARKWGIPAVLSTYVLPLPAAVIYATVGMAGMRLRTFIITDLIGSALICSLWVYLGFRLGQRAIKVVDLIARYSGYISIALVVIIVINAYLQNRRRSAAAR